MIVLVMVLLAALAAGAVAAYVLGVDAGYVLFTWQGWVLESTLAGFALLLLAVWLALWLISRVTGGALQLPSSVRGWLRDRRVDKAHQNFVRGLRELVTGEPRVAEQSLLRGIADHEAQDLSYVAAARAAQAQGAYDRRDAYLDRALALENPPLETVMAERIRLLAASGEPQRALDAARHYHGQSPKSRVALLLLAEALEGAGEYRELYALMSGPGKALTLDSRFPLTVKAFTMLLTRAAAAGELATVKSLWDEAKSEICADPGVQRAYALALARLNAESEAVAVINRALKSRWDAELVRCFGGLESIDPVAQLASIEQWLQRYGEETELLIAAGLTCARNRLWGKAGSYLDAAAASHGTPVVFWHLGQLAERNQKVDVALAHYRRGLEVAAKRPAG